MIKEIAVAIHIISSVYFMGGALAQHDKAKALVTGLENGFLRLLLNLKEKKPVETVNLLLKFFGFMTVATFAGFMIIGMLRIKLPQLSFVLLVLFLVSGLFAGSLFWVHKHKAVLKQTTYWFLFFGGGPLLFPFMDVLTHTGITNSVYSMIQVSFAPLIDLPTGRGLLYEAMVVSGFYGGLVVFFYLVAWFYAAPTALIAWVVIATPILGARFINRAFPEKPIVFIFFVLWLFSSLYLFYACGS